VKKKPHSDAPAVVPLVPLSSPTAETQPEARANVYHVAERAGVSPGTVSRVLNNRGRVHTDTRDRVFKAARALGFRPQVQVRTRQVAVVADNMWEAMRNWGYYREVWAHIAFALYKREMAMVLPDTPEDLRHKHLDGVIVIGECPALKPMLQDLRAHTPVVLTDDFSAASAHCHGVRSDQVMTGRLAARQFAKTGRRRLGFVGSWGAQEHSILEGYRAAMREAGVECHEELFVLRDPETTFYGAVSRVIRLGADALLIPGSNYEALEGINILTNVLRLQLPKDVALIGGEIHGVSKFLTPPMTTIEQPLGEVADLAVATLAALMRGETPPLQTTLPVRLIVRESA
jgi:LacI family transcriptional regulator